MDEHTLRAMEWVSGADTGLSRKCIWHAMTGVPYQDRDWACGSYPVDPDDFGRCYRLLVRFPQWRQRLSEVGRAHPKVWPQLVEAWDELTRLYEEEVGVGWDRSAHYGKRAPRLYARIREIEDMALTPAAASSSEAEAV
jgi:hypothetical protein